MALTTHAVKGQITTPIVKANFGIEADVSSNYYNNAPQPAVDDWYSNNFAGTGQFIIDTTGSAAILANYTSNPASRAQPFSKLMKQAPYTTVNNRLLLDAIFHRDFHGSDSTVFASGSNKNGMSPALWSCPVAQSIPDKNDILDAYTHVRRAGPNVTDSLWMFGAVAIENTTGSRYFDFELYQTNIVYNRATRTFSGFGPNAGHTTWQFDATGKIVSPGDIIFTAEYGGSGLSLVQARIWINKASLSMTPFSFNWGGQFDGDGTGATYGYASIVPKTAGAFYTGLMNTNTTTWTGPFRLVRDNDAITNTFLANQFMEFSVNLSKLGIDPASFTGNACGTPFRRVLIKTRSSSSFTAELKDFIAPFSLFNYPPVDATTDKTYYCRTMPTATISVYNPLSTSIYTWSTPNGLIVGSTTGTSITVSEPGTYYVTQQLHSQCPAFAMDSVKIVFDTACTLLDVNLTRFTAGRIRQNNELNWQVDHNENALSFDVEYSSDNRNFSTVATIPADGAAGSRSYTFTHRTTGNQVQTAYYRIRLTGSSRENKYSQIVSVRITTTPSTSALVYPNPVYQTAWISINSPEQSTAAVTVTDSYGRAVLRQNMRLSPGNNVSALADTRRLRAGIYYVNIRTGHAVTTQKILVVK